ncbi:MAG: hypothetical protein RQ982_02280, partial [Gammaproteobacteria bacterium]|nr:hypothetical protein [Gammaproteobacteria bacterium]
TTPLIIWRATSVSLFFIFVMVSLYKRMTGAGAVFCRVVKNIIYLIVALKVTIFYGGSMFFLPVCIPFNYL